MRICFLIPDGVGIRNYLYSEVIPILVRQGHKIILWHSLDKELIEITERRLGLNFEKYPFVHKSDSIGAQLFRESARFGRIRLNAKNQGNPTILTNWSGAATSKKGKFLNLGAQTLGNFLSSYSSVATIEALGYKLLKDTREFKEAKTFLSRIKPDVLFCTHQRVYSVTTAIEAAKAIGIPTSTAIFSWDNLPKGRLPFRVNQYLVWSEYMKSELQTYYPEIPSSQIVISGSPQFDFYFQKGIILSREEFAAKYQLDLTREWVCFSGCDTITSPHDPKYLRDVAQALGDQNDIQLIFRPVPVESVGRFSKVLSEFPEIKLLEPLWVTGSHWGNYFPLMEDIQLLVNLAFHCKVVINMGSTMALDFSTFGNVGLYLRYDHQDQDSEWSVKTIFEFQHFRSMGNWKAVGYIDSAPQILTQVRRAMENPDSVAPDRKLWFSKIVEPDQDLSSAQRVAEALLSLSQRTN